MQRHVGVEPLSLLRFSSVILHILIPALDGGFSELGQPASIEPYEVGGWWDVHESKYELRYHSAISPRHLNQDEVIKFESRRLARLEIR